MNAATYRRQQASLLANAQALARVLDAQTLACLAREKAASERRIAPLRIDPPRHAAPRAQPAQLTPAAAAVRPHPFVQAIARRLAGG